jgi:hypothetical protein
LARNLIWALPNYREHSGGAGQGSWENASTSINNLLCLKATLGFVDFFISVSKGTDVRLLILIAIFCMAIQKILALFHLARNLVVLPHLQAYQYQTQTDYYLRLPTRDKERP